MTQDPVTNSCVPRSPDAEWLREQPHPAHDPGDPGHLPGVSADLGQSDLGQSDLGELDRLAVDEFVHTWSSRPDAADGPTSPSVSLSPRARRAAELLSLLDVEAVPRVSGSLIDATLARVAHERSLTPPVLTPLDRDVLDALVDAGFDVDRLDRSDNITPDPAEHAWRARAERHARLFSVLDTPASAPAERTRLIARTLSHIQTQVDQAESRHVLAAQHGFRSFALPRVHVGDVLGVAAALLLGVSVLWPMLAEVRSRAMASACASNLASVGAAFGSYAGDYRDSLPLASESRAGNRWWDVGVAPERSNAANLFTLVRADYSSIDQLACDGNRSDCRSASAIAPSGKDWRRSENVSYSFQILFGHARDARLDKGIPSVLLVDRSPVVVRALRGEPVYLYANSDNHAGRGQNILLSDGSVRWTSSPVTDDGDNVWLPREVEMALRASQGTTVSDPIQGTETPATALDAFVGP